MKEPTAASPAVFACPGTVPTKVLARRAEEAMFPSTGL